MKNSDINRLYTTHHARRAAAILRRRLESEALTAVSFTVSLTAQEWCSLLCVVENEVGDE